MSKHVGEALNPRHSTATPNQEGTHNLELFPKEGLNPTLVAPTFKICT